MIYLQKHKSQKVKWNKFVALSASLILVILLLFLFGNNLASPFINVTSGVVNNMKTLGSQAGFLLKFLEPQLSLVRENEIYRDKLATIESQFLDYRMIKEENKNLRDRLSIESQDRVSSAILLAPPSTPFGTIIINRGKDHGVYLGAKVYLSERVGFGDVTEVDDATSKVLAYAAPGRIISAVFDRDGGIYEIEGRGNGSFSFQVPIDLPIFEGDALFLPGDEKVLIASVVSIRTDTESSFKKVFLVSPLKPTGNSNPLVEIRR